MAPFIELYIVIYHINRKQWDVGTMNHQGVSVMGLKAHGMHWHISKDETELDDPREGLTTNARSSEAAIPTAPLCCT